MMRVEPDGHAGVLLLVAQGEREPVHVVAGARLGQEDAVGPGADHAGDVVLPQAGVERVDAHVEARAALLRARVGDVLGGQRARRRLARGAHRVLQVEDQRVGAGGRGPWPSFRSSSAGMNRKRAHRTLFRAFGRLRIMAWRRHSATTSPRWLMALCRNSTMPASGRERRLALGEHLRRHMEGIAVEHGLGKPHVGHAEVADGGAERGVVDRDADHQAQREQAVDQRLAPLGLGREVMVDVQRLRVVGEAGEQRVVHLRDGAPDRDARTRARPRSPPDTDPLTVAASRSPHSSLPRRRLRAARAGSQSRPCWNRSSSPACSSWPAWSRA